MSNPIRKMRKDRDMTQAECAKKYGACQQTWCYLENRPELLDLKHRILIRVAKALGTNLVGLWTERRAMRIAAKLGEN